ncbi:MAG: hypothetical protein ABW328_03550 [Ilumatobacteraceae bacterium]
MARRARTAILVGGLSIVGLGVVPAGHLAAAVPPPSTAPVSVPSSTVVTVPTTVAGIVATRGGSAAGSVAKPNDAGWSVQQLATTTAIGVAVLAVLGFVYGRVRSAPPRHPDLAPRLPE